MKDLWRLLRGSDGGFPATLLAILLVGYALSLRWLLDSGGWLAVVDIIISPLGVGLSLWMICAAHRRFRR